MNKDGLAPLRERLESKRGVPTEIAEAIATRVAGILGSRDLDAIIAETSRVVALRIMDTAATCGNVIERDLQRLDQARAGALRAEVKLDVVIAVAFRLQAELCESIENDVRKEVATRARAAFRA